MAVPEEDETGEYAPRTGDVPARRLARRTQRSGLVLAVAATPLLFGALFLSVDAATVTSAVAWAIDAMSTPLWPVAGGSWAFHASALAALVGAWLVGFGLVVDGFLGSPPERR